MKGFEQAHIVRPGYAIEYDYWILDLKSNMENKHPQNLFFAGFLASIVQASLT